MKHWLLLLEKNEGSVVELKPVKTTAVEKLEKPFESYIEPDNNANLYDSAKHGGELGYRLLNLEGHIQKYVTATFDVHNLPINLSGRSNELLFALAVIVGILPRASGYTPFAATGALSETFQVEKVGGVAAKLQKAIEELPSGSLVFYPRANHSEIDVELHKKAAAKEIELCAVERLDEAVAKLKIAIKKIYEVPFRGLTYYDYEHRSIYFGRKIESAKLCNRLLELAASKEAAILILGVSGSGKSSFVRAKLIPALQSQNQIEDSPLCQRHILWSAWFPREAGTEPNEETLVRSIQHNWANPDYALPLAGLAEANVSTLTELGEQLVQQLPDNYQFLWLIDQMEEVFSQDFPKTVIESFVQFIKQLQANNIWVVATLRDEFYPNYGKYFAATFHQYPLGELSKTDVEAIITEPVVRSSFKFAIHQETGITLDRQLLEEAWDIGNEALPLLQFVLERLWQERDKDKRELTYEAYEKLTRKRPAAEVQAIADNKDTIKPTGSLQGAIGKYADELVAGFTAEQREALPDVLRCLIRLSDDGIVARQQAHINSFTNDTQKSLIKKLIDNRILSSNTEKDSEEPTVVLAHDCLLTAWQEAENTVEKHRQLLEEKRKLSNAAKHWERNGRPERLLMARSDEVMRAEVLLACLDKELKDATVSDFLWESIKLTRTGFRMLWVLLCVVSLGFSIVLYVFLKDRSGLWLTSIIYVCLAFFLFSPCYIRLFQSIKIKPYLASARMDLTFAYLHLIFFILLLFTTIMVYFFGGYIFKGTFSLFVIPFVVIMPAWAVHRVFSKYHFIQASKHNNYYALLPTKKSSWLTRIISFDVWKWRKLEVAIWIVFCVIFYDIWIDWYSSDLIMKKLRYGTIEFVAYLQDRAEIRISENNIEDAKQDIANANAILSFYLGNPTNNLRERLAGVELKFDENTSLKITSLYLNRCNILLKLGESIVSNGSCLIVRDISTIWFNRNTAKRDEWQNNLIGALMGAELSYMKTGGNFNPEKAMEISLLAKKQIEMFLKNHHESITHRHNLAIVLTRMAYIYNLKGEKNIAIENYKQVCSILESLKNIHSNNFDIISDIRETYIELANVAEKNNDTTLNYEMLIKAKLLLEEAIEEQLSKPSDKAIQYKELLGKTLGSISFKELFDRHFKEALSTSQRALKLAPKETWIKTNFAHALLFLNRFEEAKMVYLENPDQKVLRSGKTFRQAVLDDFKKFAGRGLIHPDMAKIEELYKNKATP